MEYTAAFVRKKFGGRPPEEAEGIKRLLEVGLPVRVINALLSEGIFTPQGIAAKDSVWLLRIPGVSWATLEDIRIALWKCGLFLDCGFDADLLALAKAEVEALVDLRETQEAHRMARTAFDQARRKKPKIDA